MGFISFFHHHHHHLHHHYHHLTCNLSSCASISLPVCYFAGFHKAYQFLLGSGGRLLLEARVAGGHAPRIRLGHGGAEGAARGRTQVFPVLAASSEGGKESVVVLVM